MYSLDAFGKMIVDDVRMQAYVRALREAVRPDSVVLDIGTGTGIFALLAHRFGARRVIAIEPNDAIQVAREIAAANDCSDIEFHQSLSIAVELAEPANIILSDLRGILPLFQAHIPSIIDARQRLLAPGGVLISQRDDLWLSVLEDAETHNGITSPWIDNPYDVDMRAGATRLANQFSRVSATASQLLTEPVHAGTLDYRTIESPDFIAQVNLRATRDGTGHGLCAWFDATLADGIGFSNAPGLPDAPRPIYRNAFFPFTAPMALRTGDELTVTLKAQLVGGDYLWQWHTRWLGHGDPENVKADYRQSSLAGEIFSPAMLKKRAASHVPQLNEDGQIDQAILQLMSEGMPLGDISRRIAAQQPHRFSDWQQALARVGELSLRYSR